MTWFLRLILGGSLVYLAGLGATLWLAPRMADPTPAAGPRASAIVVLSGPGATAPGTAGQTRERLIRGVAFWKAGVAPVLVLSGSGRGADAPVETTHAWTMAEAARDLGVPDAAIRLEARSRSTLQNAWYTAALPDVDPAQRIIVVSQRYHLPRAAFSFRWAGFREVTLVAADDPPAGVLRELLAEGVKWPFNLVRAGLGALALAADIPEARVLPWLS